MKKKTKIEMCDKECNIASFCYRHPKGHGKSSSQKVIKYDNKMKCSYYDSLAVIMEIVGAMECE